MLDMKEIRRSPDALQSLVERRRPDLKGAVDRILELDKRHRRKKREMDQLYAQHKALSRALYRGEKETRSGEPDNKAGLIQLRELGGLVKKLRTEIQALEEEKEAALQKLPNLPDNVMTTEQILWSFNEQPSFDYPVKNEKQLMTRLNLLVYGTNSQPWGYQGAGARLKTVLQDYLGCRLLENGYREMQLPVFDTANPLLHVNSEQSYSFWELPQKIFTISPTFITKEGKLNPTILHAMCCAEAEDQIQEYEALLKTAQEALEGLGLSGRVRRPSVLDMREEWTCGTCLELWLPAEKKHVEVMRVSCAGDFLARRHCIHVRGRDKRIQPVHSVHMEAEIGGIFSALAEQGQRDDGSIHIPPALWAAMGRRELSIYP